MLVLVLLIRTRAPRAQVKIIFLQMLIMCWTTIINTSNKNIVYEKVGGILDWNKKEYWCKKEGNKGLK